MGIIDLFTPPSTMPREFRKRGKKAKKNNSEKEDHKPAKHDHPPHQDEAQAGPSWIISTTKDTEEPNLEAPFGYLDADVKAYFRTVDVQIRNWQENEVNVDDGNADVDPNEGVNGTPCDIMLTAKISGGRTKAFLHSRTLRDVRQRETTRDRSRLFQYSGKDDLLNGRLCS